MQDTIEIMAQAAADVAMPETAMEQPHEVPKTLEQEEQNSRERINERHEASRVQDRASDERQAADKVEAADTDHDPESEASEGTLKLPKALAGYAQQKVAGLMKRFGLDQADLANEKTQKMLKKALDGDAYIAKLRGNAEETEAGEDQEGEPEEEQEAELAKTEEDEGEQVPEQEQQPVPRNEEESRAQYISQMQTEAMRPDVNHPAMLAQYDALAFEVLGADTPEAKVNAQKLVRAIAVGTHSQLRTVAPALMEQHAEQRFEAWMESKFPGFAQTFRDATAHNTWENLRQTGQYGQLEKFGTPEFQATASRVYKENPWLNTMTFKANGKSLSRNHPESMRQEAMIVAKILSGESVTPATVNAAIAKGKLEAEKTNRRVTAGRSLGSGKSTGGFGDRSAPEGGGLMDAYNSRGGGAF